MFLRSDRPAQPPLDAAASTEETLGVSSGRPEWKKDRDGRFRVYPVHAKSERHHELRLDRRAGGAGTVGIEVFWAGFRSMWIASSVSRPWRDLLM